MNRTITPSELRDLMRAKKNSAIPDAQSDFDEDKEMIPGAIRREPEKVTEWRQDMQDLRIDIVGSNLHKIVSTECLDLKR